MLGRVHPGGGACAATTSLLLATEGRPLRTGCVRLRLLGHLPKYFQGRFKLVQDLTYSRSWVAGTRGLAEGRRLRVALLQTLEEVALKRRTRTRVIRWSIATIGVLIVLAMMLSMLPGQLP